ncbi:16S rRNA (adenine(1518)-N(6)/adenine(1519)-N(6))-dimethyltransferase RsmA [Weeksellaceae bacterium KMM 9713]|uniref:Ribosomal RNA small subunit methyltransferase A n=1 Tax=Profundicola chukchiensis TaxID=2961959 RepID=A0A9X4MY36_9FLAO|nr:16S rRNA (adenine(1518)-N(6)/adenine(1519)-N(6))-dimethyltransferase RsmA [Profundicola chukchiensis]MDG4946986.1 16S rRNA (adenine(1518)-N(6)/adenine(1519)-N(6))-dimethyltransferase RsmA [Profundicola chukchiensis]
MSVRAKKHLGQHFLNDKNIAEQIVNSLTWENYHQVLEIGPGMGVLTEFLLEQKRNVSVVEIDRDSIAYLKEKYNGIKEVLPIYEEDFLKMDLASEFKEDLAVVGNFPYNISSQILFKVIDHKDMVPEVVGMFQKEVAERVAAPHGNKTYGVISVLIQAYYKVEYLFTVHEHVFTPPPKVKSGVIRLNRFRQDLEVNDKKFKQVVKAGFSQRRKTLRNALKQLGIPESQKDHKFFSMRAEQLSVEDFIELTKIMTG